MTRILVFNFFRGIMERGIPLYASDIAECLRRIGLEPIELRSPRIVRRLPRPVRNLLFALAEQLLAPLLRVLYRCRLTIYPYNSVGVIDAALGRAVLVVHDLTIYHRENTAFSACYVRATQAVHVALRRPICAASPHTLEQLRRLSGFRRCPIELWSNPFYSFEAALASTPAAQQQPESPTRLRVLLCSGMGRYKDYAGALRLFRRSAALRDAELRIVGFGADAYLARRRVEHLPGQVRKRIEVLPRLSVEELIAEYRRSDLVWVHSRREGFGRWIVEARLCGRPVLATDIPAFRRFARAGLEVYRNEDFDRHVEAALKMPLDAPRPSLAAYHVPLEAAVREVIAPFMPSAASTRVVDQSSPD